MKLSERIREEWDCYSPSDWRSVAKKVAKLEAENARLVKVASHMDDCNTWSYVGEPCDCHMGLIADLEEENERLQGLVDIENTYGHLYLVTVRYVKDEWGEDKYWELFDAVCEHFDALKEGG